MKRPHRMQKTDPMSPNVVVNNIFKLIINFLIKTHFHHFYAVKMFNLSLDMHKLIHSSQ